MPVVIVVLLLVLLGCGCDMFLNPVGTTITGMPTRFPRQTLSQSVALPMNASTVKLSLTSWINFPLALCAYTHIMVEKPSNICYISNMLCSHATLSSVITCT